VPILKDDLINNLPTDNTPPPEKAVRVTIELLVIHGAAAFVTSHLRPPVTHYILNFIRPCCWKRRTTSINDSIIAEARWQVNGVKAVFLG